MFSLSDFLDFLTSKDGPIDPVKEALRAPEGIIIPTHPVEHWRTLPSCTVTAGPSWLRLFLRKARVGNHLGASRRVSSIRHRAYKHLRVGAWNPGPTKEIPPGEMA